jgi:hypothetical protein
MDMRPRFPQTQANYLPLVGGLDLVTPRIRMNAGRCIDAQNYEPLTVGGYRRINGFERFDGHTSPTSAAYWTITATITGNVSTGNTVTGATSAATGKVLTVSGSIIVLGRVTGTFVSGENLQVGGTTQATATSTAVQGGASTAALDAAWRLLAANDRRADIAAIPGSGQVRGIFVLADTVYAFRDNANATASILYKATASGWQAVTLGKEILFSGSTAQINVGDTVTGASSGASAVVVRALLRSGTWSSAGAGSLVFATVTGAFTNGENLQVGGTTKAVAASASTQITRAAGGRAEVVIGNFTGSSTTRKAYGCDGVNPAFEFDGTNYVPIHTGMTTDTPTHVEVHKNKLFLAFASSIQYSATNDPGSWTLLTGANEIGLGDTVTALVSQTGNSSGASLAIFTSGKTYVLYGSSSADFQLVPSIYELGYMAYTAQPVANNTYGLTARGVQALITTLNYGDFSFDALSFNVQPIVQSKYSLATASVTLRGKNQYRLYFSDGTGLVFGLTGEKLSGIMPLNYGKTVRVVWNSVWTTGAEHTYFGSDDGYVYEDNVGTSFDGNAIEAWIRPAFNNLQSPRVMKRFRRAVFEASCEGYASINIGYDIGYANPDVSPAAVQSNQPMVGAGMYWDSQGVVWEQFTWDAPVLAQPQISIDGTENNIGFICYSNSAQDDPVVWQGVSLLFTPRHLTR